MHDKIFDLFWVNYKLYFYAQLIFRIYGLDKLNIVIDLVRQLSYNTPFEDDVDYSITFSLYI